MQAEDEMLHIVMEYCDGGDLAALVKPDSPEIPEQQVGGAFQDNFIN